MDILGIAGQGLTQATQQFEKAATRVSQSVDPEDIVELSSAKNQMEANLATMKVSDEIEKKTVNLLA